MTKYNLGLGVFIAVVASSAYILGFFTAAYVGRMGSTEQTEAFNKLNSSFTGVVELAKDQELSEKYQQFHSDKLFLKSLQNLNPPPQDLIQETARDLDSVIPSLECMLAQFHDPEMRSRAVEQINEVRQAIKSLKNDSP